MFIHLRSSIHPFLSNTPGSPYKYCKTYTQHELLPMGSFTVCNRGDYPIAIDVELIKYDNIDQQNIFYKDVAVSPGDTIAHPRERGIT